MSEQAEAVQLPVPSTPAQASVDGAAAQEQIGAPANVVEEEKQEEDSAMASPRGQAAATEGEEQVNKEPAAQQKTEEPEQ